MELKFHLLHFAANGVVIIRTGLFPALEYFLLGEHRFLKRLDEHRELHTAEDDVMAHLCFEVGTMPKLRRLELCLSEEHWGGATPDGMEHLLALQQIKLIIFLYREGSDFNEWKRRFDEVKRRAESAFRDALQAHPNRPSVSTN